MTPAQIRANDLLMSYLTPEQKASYLQTGRFTVRGNVSGNEYILNYDETPRFFICPKTRTRFSAYIGFFSHYPAADHLLAQKFFLENDEKYIIQKSCYGLIPPHFSVGR